MATDEKRILEQYTRVKANCELWHERIEEYGKLYDLNHYKKPALSGERRVTLSKAMNIVDLAVGVLSANALTIEAISAEDNEETQRRAGLIEKFLDGVLYVNSERQESDLRYEWTFLQVRDGACGIRTLWDTQFDATLQQDKFGELPVSVNVIPARYLFPEPGGKLSRWKRIFYAVERTIEDVESEYGEIAKFRTMSTRDKQTRKEDFIDYWGEVRVPLGACPNCGAEMLSATPCINCGYDGEPTPQIGADGQPAMTWRVENAVLYGNRLIKPPQVMPGYDHIPYTLIFYKPIGQVEPHEWGQSALRPIEKLLPEMEWRINRQTRLLNIFANMPMIARVRDGRPIEVDSVFGDVVHLSEGEDLAFPQWPGQPPDAREQMGLLSAEMQESSFPTQMYGGGAAASSGYALSQMGDAGRIRLTQPQKQQESALSVWAQKTLGLLRNFAPTQMVQVYGRLRDVPYTAELTGQDTEGFRVNFSLTPQFPNDEMRKVAMSTQTKDLLSSETRMEKYLGVQQPDQEVSRMLRELAERHPMMVEYKLMAYFQERASRGDTAAAQVLERMASQQVAPPGGEGGNKPEPYSGLPTNQPGQVTQQEAGLAPPGQEPLQEQEAMGREAQSVPLTPQGMV